MIAFDTNLVVRLVTGDDFRQLAEVHRVMAQALENGETCLITDIVLCELEWVLTGPIYKGSRDDVTTAVQRLLEQPTFQVENPDRLRRALDAYTGGKGDLSDYLLGATGADFGVRTTLTFDKALQGHPAFTVLRP